MGLCLFIVQEEDILERLIVKVHLCTFLVNLCIIVCIRLITSIKHTHANIFGSMLEH